MLVLSRRTKERVLFPGLDIRVEVLTARPGVVRLGIEAPPGVVVAREEVAPAPGAPGAAPKLRHVIRNRLNAAAIGLALLRQQLERGLYDKLAATLGTLDEEVRQLREHFESPPPPAPGRQPRRLRTLLVEDDHNERELLAGFLRLAGLDVATAGDGADALDHLRAGGRPDVLLLDMALPRCDGPAVLRALGADPASGAMKVFALSGYTAEHFRLDPAAAGVARWFQKPIHPEALLRALRQELGTPG